MACRGDSALYRPLLDHLLDTDSYLLLADYRSYVDVQAEVSQGFRDSRGWTAKSIRNVAGAGKFSSDRAIREYCETIWGAVPVPVPFTG